jgi:hypothetical protein
MMSDRELPNIGLPRIELAAVNNAMEPCTLRHQSGVVNTVKTPV